MDGPQYVDHTWSTVDGIVTGIDHTWQWMVPCGWINNITIYLYKNLIYPNP